MLTSSYLSTITLPKDTNSKESKSFLTKFALILIILLVIDIYLLYLAFTSISRCYNAGKITGIVAILLGIGLFVPYIGFAVLIGVLIMGNVVCPKVDLPAKFMLRY